VAFNFWFEHVIDTYLIALATGADWKAACAEAECNYTGPVRVLSREDLATVKGIRFSRQHIDKKVRDGMFPRPFQTPSLPQAKSSSPQPKKRKKAAAESAHM